MMWEKNVKILEVEKWNNVSVKTDRFCLCNQECVNVLLYVDHCSLLGKTGRQEKFWNFLQILQNKDEILFI